MVIRGGGGLGLGVPVIFSLELVGKGCHISREVEMVEARSGVKREAFGKDRVF